ncbi:MAG TPA: hypothetical protein VK880_07420 [Anaerolineales bacterium]|nr:hypothetical protein [Anaerolineales bacterium]
MEPLAYLHLQMRLEGKVPVNTCLLRQVETVPDEELPLMPVARLARKLGLLPVFEEIAITQL